MSSRVTKDDLGRLVKAYLKGLLAILIVGVPLVGFFYLVDWGFGVAGVDFFPDEWTGQKFLMKYGFCSLFLFVLFYFSCKYPVFEDCSRHKWLNWMSRILWILSLVISGRIFGFLVSMASLVTVGPFMLAFGEYKKLLRTRRGTEDTR